MAEHLQCGVCFEPYTAGSRLPKFLQCGGGIQHTYCLQCLRRLTVGGMIKCPCCGDLTSVRGLTADSLKNNIYLMPQIEAAAAAAARARNGLQMFCKTCTAVATEHCGEHQLLKMSELRDELRELAAAGAANMETVRRRRAEVMALFREAHSVLASVAESVRHTVEDYEMDVQLDDNIVVELERKREAAEQLPSDQLADSYRLIEQHASDATLALHDMAAAEECRALLGAAVSVTSDGNGLGQTFTVGEWLHSGDLMKALLAASVVVYSLDHVTSDEADADAQPLKGSEGVEPVAAGKVDNVAGTKPSKENSSGDDVKSISKPSSKSPPSSNGKASGKSSKSAADVSVSKASVAASDGKVRTSTSVANGTTTGKVNDSGKSSKAATASDKQAKKTTASRTTDSAAPAAKTNGQSSATKPTTATAVDRLSAKIDEIDRLAARVFQTSAALLSASASKPAPAATSASKSTPAATSAAKSTPTSDAKPKPPPSFSTMVKSSPSAADPAGWSTVQRARRGAHPMYCLRVTNGTSATDVIVELRPDMAPIMCKNFITLCEGGFFDNSRFHFAVHADYLLGGRVDDDEGFSPLADEPDKFVMADQCPLQDECGAIRMKGMGTVTGPGGEKRGLIGSQFMMWVSETRDYRQYQYTLVFGFIRQGLDFIRAISTMERPAIWRNARLLSTRPYQQ